MLDKNRYMIDSLTMETTRRCNMECVHCLRGNAQNVDILESVVKAAISPFKEIGCLSFTGGEPALFVEGLKYSLNALKHWAIPLGRFYLVTNGREASDEFLHALLDLWVYSEEQLEEIGCVEISQTAFHEDQGQDLWVIKRLMALRFANLRYVEERHGMMSYANQESIIKMGRAIEYGLGESIAKDRVFAPSVQRYQNDCYIGEADDVYINVHGDVIIGCDWSYAAQKRHKIGNVLEQNLAELLVEKFEDKEERNADGNRDVSGVEVSGSP